MVTYAIGDVQGCGRTLLRLHARLREAGFDESRDELWLAGDLVNRGPRSLEALRWAVEQQRRMGTRFVCVLGNHDLHLLGVAGGVARSKAGDTLDALLEAPDRDELIEWLRLRPLLHRAEVGGRPHLLVHAGLLPQWSAERAAALAREVETALAGADWPFVVAELLRHRGDAYDERATGHARLGGIVAGLLWLRTCTAEGRLCADFKGPPEQAPQGCLPWFDVPGRQSRDQVLVCGHWAALGLRLRDDLVALDSACVWGQSLSAVRLDDRAVFQQPNVERDDDSRG
jgi:bis(5'-nucleosyl)-tetraphosphatase (symmetrical)